MKARVSFSILSVVLMVSTFALAADQAKVEKERQEIRKRTKEILAQLYKAEPSAILRARWSYSLSVTPKRLASSSTRCSSG